MTNLNLMRLVVMYSEDHYRNAFYENLKSEITETTNGFVATVSTDDGEVLKLELNNDIDYIKATINISPKEVEIPVSLAVNDSERAVYEMWSNFYSC